MPFAEETERDRRIAYRSLGPALHDHLETPRRIDPRDLDTLLADGDPGEADHARERPRRAAGTERVTHRREAGLVMLQRGHRLSREADRSVGDHEAPGAEAPHRAEVVADEEHRAPLPRHRLHPAEGLALEGGVPHRQHLVHHEDLRLGWAATSNEAHVHPARVPLDGGVHEPLEAGGRRRSRRTAAAPPPASSEDRPVEDVLPPGEVGVEAGPTPERARETPAQSDLAAGRAVTRRGPSAASTSRPVAADDADHLARLDGEGDVRERPEMIASGIVRGAGVGGGLRVRIVARTRAHQLCRSCRRVP